MTGFVVFATTAAVVVCGLSAGVFFAFSTFVLDGIDRLPPAQSIGTMQAVNRAAPTPLFMIVLFAPAALGLGSSVWALTHRGEPAAPWLVAGTTVYILGVLVVTVAANVPLNDTLAALPATAGATAWSDFFEPWMWWNHVRTLAATAAASLYAVGLVLG